MKLQKRRNKKITIYVLSLSAVFTLLFFFLVSFVKTSDIVLEVGIAAVIPVKDNLRYFVKNEFQIQPFLMTSSTQSIGGFEHCSSYQLP